MMKNREQRIKYLKIIVAKVPVYQSSFTKRFKIKNDAYSRVVSLLAAELRRAGRSREAAHWEAR